MKRGGDTRAREAGIALVTVLLVLLLFFIILFGLSTFSVGDRKASLDQVRSLQAYYIADAGISYLLYMYRVDKAMVGDRDFTAKTQYKITPADSGMSFGVPNTFGHFEAKSFDYNPSDADANISEAPGLRPTLRIRSIGSLYQGDPAACPGTPCGSWTLLARRTLFAKIVLCAMTGTPGDLSCPDSTFRPVLFYEKFR